MTVETRQIQQVATDVATPTSIARMVRIAAAAVRRPFHTIDHSLHAGQLGPMSNATIGRHTGGRI